MGSPCTIIMVNPIKCTRSYSTVWKCDNCDSFWLYEGRAQACCSEKPPNPETVVHPEDILEKGKVRICILCNRSDTLCLCAQPTYVYQHIKEVDSLRYNEENQ